MNTDIDVFDPDVKTFVFWKKMLKTSVVIEIDHHFRPHFKLKKTAYKILVKKPTIIELDVETKSYMTPEVNSDRDIVPIRTSWYEAGLLLI